jgi:heat shock protein HslJ
MIKFIGISFLLFACSTSKKKTNLSKESIEGKWQLLMYQEQKITPHLNQYMLTITKNQLYFKGICNEIVGELEDNAPLQIKFNNLSITEMECDFANFDNTFFTMFENCNNYTINNDTLCLNKFKMAPLSIWVRAKN